jgi:hypothetical protein
MMLQVMHIIFIAYPNSHACPCLGVTALANAIPDMRALTSLNVADNNLGILVLPDGWTKKTVESQEEYDAYGNEVFVHTAGQKQKENPGKPMGLIAIATAIKDMRAISSVNVLFNDIGAEQAHALANVLKEHVTLKSLCGNKGNETELDMSGKKIGADGAIMLAPEIADNGALTSLNLAKNHLGSRCGKGKYSNPNPDNDDHWEWHADMSGIVAIADVIPGMGAMTSLSLASNDLGVEGAKIVAAVLPKCT